MALVTERFVSALVLDSNVQIISDTVIALLATSIGPSIAPFRIETVNVGCPVIPIFKFGTSLKKPELFLTTKLPLSGIIASPDVV